MILVSVIMSVYNGEKYLRQAIDSILDQTYKNIEFLIIEDGSTDSSLKIIESYSDKRIRLIKNGGNKGLIYSLNRGFSLANGKYIARMDCDDISYLNRIEEQVRYLEENIDVALLGTSVDVVFEGIPFLKKRTLAEIDWELIRLKSLFISTFNHPSVMIRKKILDEKNLRYEEKYKNAEDYGLWTNIIKNYKSINLSQGLLRYRIVKQSVTRKANRDITSRKEVFKKIYNNYMKQYGIDLTENELELHFEICMIQNLNNYSYSVKDKEKYMKKLKEAFLRKGFSKEKVDKVFSQIFIKTYLYHKEKIMDKEIIIENNIKKIQFIEGLKKQVKKIYK